jgi:Flp pilus assembly pilin Flp
MSKKIVTEAHVAFLKNDDGSVAVEYSLIAGAMFLAISPAFYLVRDSINVKFQSIVNFLAAN